MLQALQRASAAGSKWDDSLPLLLPPPAPLPPSSSTGRQLVRRDTPARLAQLALAIDVAAMRGADACDVDVSVVGGGRVSVQISARRVSAPRSSAALSTRSLGSTLGSSLSTRYSTAYTLRDGMDPPPKPSPWPLP
jgi:hypothetical protein